MKKIRIDGIEVEVSEQTAQLFEKAQAASAAALTEATTKAEKAAARADGLEKELKDAKTALAEAPAKARADIEARIKLEGVARRVLGAEVKVDGVDAADLRRQIAATEAPEGVKLEEKTDAYVEVLFDKAVAKLDEKKAVDDVLEKTKPVELPVEKPATLIEAAAQMFKTGKVIR